MGGIGTEKICPLAQVLTEETRNVSHCRDDCEWNDGEGCAIWRIVKALERLYIIRIEKPESFKFVGKGGDSK